MDSMHKHPVVCFGEVLWDILPSGTEPGGAPMNVAYHLSKQKKSPAIISKTGMDKNGENLISILTQRGVCTYYVQTDNKYETGKVYAKLNDNNEVSYDIVMPVAWDFIQWQDELQSLVSAADFFVFGSLAARNSVSQNTLFSLLDSAKNKVLDINLRAPHFNKQLVEELLRKADFVKMNLAELELISGWFSNFSSIEDMIKLISDRFSVATLVVTMGGDGAWLFMNGIRLLHTGFKVTVADTVGSGDAFLAGLLSKLLENSAPADALDFASRLGAFIATQIGACPEYEPASIDKLFAVPTV